MATAAFQANDVNKISNFRLRAKSWAKMLVRILQAGLVVVVVCGLGRYLGIKYGPLVLPEGNEQLVKYSLFSAAGLSTLKELLGTIPKFWQYVKTGQGESLYDFSSFVLLTSLTLAVASLGIPTASGGSTTTQSSSNPLVFVVPASGRNTKFLVPFGENAEGCTENTPEFRQGLTRLEGTDKFIVQLTHGLAQCSTNKRKVKVEIRGFASSADFKARDGRICPNSNDLNVAIANRRAEKVAELMSTALTDSEAISITPMLWKNSEFEAMRLGALFNDRDGQNQPVQGRSDLTRRADIIVTDAGDCEPR